MTDGNCDIIFTQFWNKNMNFLLSRFFPIYRDFFFKYPLLVYFNMNNSSRTTTTSPTVATIAIVSAILLLGAVVVIPILDQAHALTSREGPIKRLIQRGLSIAREFLGGSQQRAAR
jgi:ABC-type phosphate/phosphonate transport system permease subunit